MSERDKHACPACGELLCLCKNNDRQGRWKQTDAFGTRPPRGVLIDPGHRALDAVARLQEQVRALTERVERLERRVEELEPKQCRSEEVADEWT
jgi:hypothetical protein